jgi:hypothetical protein
MIVPVGATGYVAREIHQEVVRHFDHYFPNHAALRSRFEALQDGSDVPTITAQLIDLLNVLVRGA